MSQEGEYNMEDAIALKEGMKTYLCGDSPMEVDPDGAGDWIKREDYDSLAGRLFDSINECNELRRRLDGAGGMAELARLRIEELENSISDSTSPHWPKVRACGSLDDPAVVLTFPDGASGVYAYIGSTRMGQELWSRVNERDALPEAPKEGTT